MKYLKKLNNCKALSVDYVNGAYNIYGNNFFFFFYKYIFLFNLFIFVFKNQNIKAYDSTKT